ncbi:uncharacterized protein LOC112589342 [Harpegnathos saltator]|uniref:uncharacterized protein LOC112589342 n=1 Tax=Harpegnathos saltator TaxID=610380 RepID=UPI000DBED950|nr:uncharacterized protein LOC112589342 [Harpegnathos saltator]
MQTQSYTNSQHQFQLATSSMGQPSTQQHAATMASTDISAPNEAQILKTNNMLQTILKCVETNRDRKRMPRKPDNLPIRSLAEMEAFEMMNDEKYDKMINYFTYIGGFNLKEAINLCFKEGMKDEITASFTWWGREGGPRSLYNTRLIMAIYEGVCRNQHFNKPTRSEFQIEMREALRTAKQRHRNKQRQPRAAGPNRSRHNFWTEEGEEDHSDN